MPKAKTKAGATKRTAKTDQAKGAGKPALGGMIRARIDPALKTKAERVLERLGISPSEAIRMFYAQIHLGRGLPFAVEIPNAATRAAMQAAEAGQVTRYANPDELFEDLGI